MTVLLVIASILLFLGLDWVVRQVRARSGSPASVPAASIPAPALPVRIPDGIFFSRSHTWLNLFPSGKIRLGVDDFVSRLLDNPSVAFLTKPGEHVNRGDPILELKEEGHFLRVRTPVSGIILSTNDSLIEHPEKMKELLFSDGWAMTVQPDRTSQIRHLLLGEETHRWIHAEFSRLRDLLASVPGTGSLAKVILQDGGVPVAGLIRKAPEEVWRKFEREFLTEAW